MAIMRFYRPLSDAADSIVGYDFQPTSLVVRYQSGDTETYGGVFTYIGNVVTGGIANTYTLANNGSPIWTIEGLNAPAASLYNSVVNFDISQFVNLVFGASDEIWGSSGGDQLVGFAGADTIIAMDEWQGEEYSVE